jgi:hypothetical protein
LQKIILFILSLLLTRTLIAESFQAKLVATEKAQENNFLLKFSNGRVAFTTSPNANLEHTNYQVSVDEDQNLLQLQVSDDRPEAAEEKNYFLSLENAPTLISEEEARKIFHRLNSNYKRSSECSNRAHVWAWEEFKNNKITSEKVYVLFTASYINRHRFKWWFHVAPLLSVQTGDQVEKWVFDFMFNPHPVTIKQWTDGFVYSHRPCQLTERFSEYDVNPQTEDCYLMIDSMFTWNPIDMKNQELYGRYKTQFVRGEINFAYQQAFK